MKRFFTIPRVLVLSFASVIALGALTLTASFSAARGVAPHTFIDSLFMSTSAVCVTGLTVLDSGRQYSPFGQAALLGLIQVGGLGILTFSNLLILARFGRIGLRERQILGETHGGLPHISAASLLLKVMSYTFVIESLGAALLTARFARDYPFAKALWLGVFHSVAAFCNAGFSLFTDNLMRYYGDWIVNLTIMSLIVLGGLGFIVFADLGFWTRERSRIPRPRLSLHSKTVIATTAILIVTGAAAVFLLEWRGSALKGSLVDRVTESFFISITARTAGFNTTDTAQLTNATLLAVILLMFIGASPGSTGGGIKTTTCAILFAMLISRGRNRPKVELMKRSIPMETVAKALATFFGFAAVMLAGVVLLQITELTGQPAAQHRGKFIEHLFEVVSGMGTVGLSTGVSPTLTSAGKLVIIGCMFLGRLGPVLVATSLIGERRRLEYSYPEERLIVG